MSIIDYPKAIKETLEDLLQREREQSMAFVRDRIRFLRLLKSGRCSSQGQAGELIGLCSRSGQRLWKLYCEGGLKALLAYPYQGSRCRLNEEQREQLNTYLAEDEVQFLHEAGHYIQKQFGVHYSTSGLHKLFGRMKVKKKTGRPSNYRKDEKETDAFKKSSLSL
jgi:transposase